MHSPVFRRLFKRMYGVSPFVASKTWELIGQNLPHHAKPKHMLWALLFLKVYGTEHVHAGIVNVDEQTFRKWSCAFVKLISKLDLVSFNAILLYFIGFTCSKPKILTSFRCIYRNDSRDAGRFFLVGYLWMALIVL